MTPTELRQSLTELKGQRAATFVFAGVADHIATLTINNAMLVPEEPDGLVKLTDGQSIYVLDAERVTYFKLGLPTDLQ